MAEGAITKLKTRMSNYELLRIVAMLLIMFGHSHLRIHPFAGCDTPLMTFLQSLSACVSTMGVGIFITISGWFGIRYKAKGLVQYLFQVSFVLWTVYALAIIIGVTSFNSIGIKESIGLYEGYWFIIGYLGLYIISPILNSFIENASKKTCLTILASLLLFQSFYSWLTAWYDYYNGYSIILFTSIYLTAAYFRKYPVAWIEKYAPWLFSIIVLVMALVTTSSLTIFGHAARMVRDDNPLVITACVLLLLSFKKLHFQNKVINWLAASCFSVYLVHYNPYVYPYFMSIMKYVYGEYAGLVYCGALILALCAVYLICTLFDQFRVIAWHGVMAIYNKTHSK